MGFTHSNWLRCSLAALLFTFAVTADVVVKAVVDYAGHDANNPVVWIEHKCAGHAGKSSQAIMQQHATITFAPAALPLQDSMQIDSGTPVQVESSQRSTQDSPPLNLRC